MNATVTNPAPVAHEVRGVRQELESLRAEMIAFVEAHKESLCAVDPGYRLSAVNLLHYLAMRGRDLRPLQLKLAALGLSSLGRAESAVLSTVNAVLSILDHLIDDPSPRPLDEESIDFRKGQRLLAEHMTCPHF